MNEWMDVPLGLHFHEIRNEYSYSRQPTTIFSNAYQSTALMTEFGERGQVNHKKI